MKRLHSNRGIALPLAVFALVVVGAMVAGSFFIGMQEQRVGRNTVMLQQAFAAAEAGAQQTAAEWDPGVYNGLAYGGSVNIDGTVGTSGWYRGEVRRLNELLFLVRSEGFSADSTARQQVGLLLRLRPIELNVNAALETQGEIEVAGNAVIQGDDTLPISWAECSAPSGGLPGLRIADTDSIDYQGNNYTTDGDPPVEEDGTINDSTLTTFGDQTFDELINIATFQLPGNTQFTPYRVRPRLDVAAACDRSGTLLAGQDFNMGEPYLAAADLVPECQSYFPIVWVNGDLHLNQSRGQGVLIVDGDLYVAGLTELFGPVLVKGRLIAQGGGANVPHFYGGLIVAGLTATDSSRVAGNAEIYYSSCAIRRALTRGAPAFLLRSRNWVNMY